MQIYTSYFGQLKNLIKDNITPIAISRYIPKYYSGLVYQKIAPSEYILNNFRNSHFEYIERFNNDILYKLNPLDVYNDLLELSNGNDISLLCYELPYKFCHRVLVSNWLNENIPNINISEYSPNKCNTNALF